MKQDAQYPEHFDGRRFFNPGRPHPRTFRDFLRWRLGRRGVVPWPKRVTNPPCDVPPFRVDGERLRISYVGHVTVLIQVCGLNVLTDPVWSVRASPLPFLGPRRRRAPGMALADLPTLDAVLVSHNHYDHLDTATLRCLAARQRPAVYAPLGNGAIIRRVAPRLTVHEMDWGNAVELGNGVRLHLEPMQHWSARSLFDRNRALWGAFVLETPVGNILFVGDSGYGDGETFRAHRRKFGGFRVALLPIGAYEPRWFMEYSHMNPHEAVLAMKDLDAAYALATHFEVFPLADDAYDAPRRALEEARRLHQIPPHRFPALEPGQAWWVPQTP